MWTHFRRMRSLQRATACGITWRRSRRLGESRLEGGPIVHRGKRRWRREPRAVWIEFLHLTWPAIPPVLLCVAAQFASDQFLQRNSLVSLLPALVLPAALVLTIRAGTASARPMVRALAMLVCASPAVYIALLWLGLLR